MEPSCLTCRHRVYRVVTVGGKRIEEAGCRQWSGYFPNQGQYCPMYEREIGSDDE